jgi:hypothetical protein
MDGGRGSIAVYSFKNINDVFLSGDVSKFQQMMYGGGIPDMDEGDGDDDGSGSRRGKGGMEFTFQTGAVNRLKILLPAREQAEDDMEGSAVLDGLLETETSDAGENEEDSGAEMGEWFDVSMVSYAMPVGFDPRYAQQYAGNMMQQGMAVGVEVAFNGRITGSNASHTNAFMRNRIVVIDMDSSRRDKKRGKDARNDGLYDFYDFNRFMKGLAKVPGTIIETNHEVAVTFE